MWKQWCYISSCEKFRRHITSGATRWDLLRQSGTSVQDASLWQCRNKAVMVYFYIQLHYTFAQLEVWCAVTVAKVCASFGFAFPALSFLVWFCFPWQDFLEKYQSCLSSDTFVWQRSVPHTLWDFSHSAGTVSPLLSSGTGSLTNSALWKSKRHHHALNKQDGSKKNT